MTEKSYWRNVRRGVTGEDTGTCGLAAFDRISLHYGISTETYELGDRLGEYCDNILDAGKRLPEQLIKRLDAFQRHWCRELGVADRRTIRRTCARDVDQLENCLQRLLQHGYRPAVAVEMDGGAHAVGIIRRGPRLYEARSTWTEFRNDRRVPVEELFRYIEKPQQLSNYRSSTNVMALPPESGSRRFRS